MCDIAALKATKIFYELLPQEDKEKLKIQDHFLIDLIKNEQNLDMTSLLKHEELESTHGISNSNHIFKESWNQF